MVRAALSDSEIAAFRTRAIAVAEQLFATHGIEGLTMRALAKELGCSPMTPYRYFESQEHLIAELRATGFAQLAADQEATVAGLEVPLDRIFACRQSYISYAISYPNRHRLLFNLRPPPHRHSGLEEAFIRAFRPLQQAVVDAVGHGDLAGDPRVIAHLIWAEIHGMVALALSDKLNFGCGLQELREHSLLTTTLLRSSQ